MRYAPLIRKIESVRQALGSARLKVYLLIVMPLAERSSESVMAAVSGMFSLIPPFVAAVSDLSTIAIQADPELLDGLSGMRMVSSLREYAGQAGSKFTAPIITQRPLTKTEVIEIGKLYGRIEQLRSLLDIQMRAYKNNVAYNTALSYLDEKYFGKGFPLLGQLLQIGLVSGGYQLTTTELAACYASLMASILTLRDVILEDLIREA